MARQGRADRYGRAKPAPILAAAILIGTIGLGSVAAVLNGARGPSAPAADITPWLPETLEMAPWITVEVRRAAATVRAGTILTGTVYEQTFPVALPPDEGIRIAALPQVARPSGSRVAFALYDGAASTVWLVDLRNGGDRLVHRTTDIVATAVHDSIAGRTYFGAANPVSLGWKGLHAVDGSVARELVPPDPAWDVRPKLGEVVQLLLSPDGRTLSLHVCGGERCRLRVYEAHSGQLLREVGRLQYGRAIGMTNDSVVTDALPSVAGISSEDGSHPVLVVPVAAGQPSLVGTTCSEQAQLAYQDGLPLLAVANKHPDCGGRYEVITVHLTDGSSNRVIRAMDASLALVRPDPSASLLLPDGWILFGPLGVMQTNAGEPQPRVISLRDGREVIAKLPASNGN